MKPIKEIIRENLIFLRKKNNYTQLQVAEKLNYSDKAVSRWENGESLPDYDVLENICEIYDVDFTYLFKEHDNLELDKEIIRRKDSKTALTILFILTVWTIATVVFALALLIRKINFWQAFIWAIPLSAVVLIITNHLRVHSKFLFIFSYSMINWGLLLGLFCQLIHHPYIWLLFIIGIPLEACIVVLAYVLYRR